MLTTFDKLRKLERKLANLKEKNQIQDYRLILSLQRNASLEIIGTDEKDPEDFVTLIKRKMLSDYQELFLKLEQYLSKF